MICAPIALFVYSRPDHTRRAVEALKRNELAADSELTIFSDGPKSGAQIESVNEVRRYIRGITGFKSVTVVERPQNLGLARSVIDGVTSLVNEHGRVIVLEDDLLTSPYFLTYMNEALEKYKNSEQVMQISGYMFPVEIGTNKDALFLPFTTSWGWATWRRAWQHFDASAGGYANLKNDRAKRMAFDLEDSYPYFKMLESQLRGEIDSWAIRWWLSVFLCNGLVLYPCQSLVENIGFDGSGTHRVKCGYGPTQGDWERKLSLPEEVELSTQKFAAVIKFLKKEYPAGIGRWIKYLGGRLTTCTFPVPK